MENYFPIPSGGQQSQLVRERVLQDIRTLVADGEVLLMVAADDLGQAARHARERLAEMIGHAKNFMVDAQQHPIESARVVLAKTESAVKKHPLAALGVAFGAGLCVGALLSRRSRD